MSRPEIFTPDEVAKILKCSVSAVRNLIVTGKLQAVQVSIGTKKHYRISSAHLEAYLSQPVESAQAIPQPRNKPSAPKLVTSRHLRLK